MTLVLWQGCKEAQLSSSDNGRSGGSGRGWKDRVQEGDKSERDKYLGALQAHGTWVSQVAMKNSSRDDKNK